MKTIAIDTELCCGDELCLKVCPAGCFRMKEGKAHTVPLAQNICIECGQCMAICPKAAIRLDGLAPTALEAASLSIRADDFVTLMKTRRSTRIYKEALVPRAVLETALEAVRYAPTGKNRQDIEWLAVEGRDKLHVLVEMMIDQMRPMKDAARLVEAFDAGQDPIFRGAPCAVFAHTDVSVYHLSGADGGIATGYLELMLHAMGLASCWAGYALGIIAKTKTIRDYLNLPDTRNVVGALMLGYPKYKYARIPARKPLRLTWM